MTNDSWCINTSSEDILNFIVYIGCVYGFIDNKKYIGKEILWPNKSLNIDVDSDKWESWFQEAVNLEVDRICTGKHQYSIFEDYMPPKFLNVKNQSLKNCCIDTWPKFHEWWYMLGGGKNALNFIEGIIHNDLYKYVKEVERIKRRKLEPFKLYINLLYSGLSENIELKVHTNEYFIITSNPFGTFNEEWWMKKLNEIG